MQLHNSFVKEHTLHQGHHVGAILRLHLDNGLYEKELYLPPTVAPLLQYIDNKETTAVYLHLIPQRQSTPGIPKG